MSAAGDRGGQHEETDAQQSRDGGWQDAKDQHAAVPPRLQSHSGILLLAVGVLIAHHPVSRERHFD